MISEREIHRRGFALGYDGRMPLELRQEELPEECEGGRSLFFFDGLLRGHLERERERALLRLAEACVVSNGSRAMIAIPLLSDPDETERWSELVVDALQKLRIAEVELSREPPPPLQASLTAEGIPVLRVLVPTPMKR